MHQRIVSARLIFSIGIAFLIFSLVFGWISFSVPDWLQFYERNISKNDTTLERNSNGIKKFGLWYKCSYIADSNDFSCRTWNKDAPSFVRVVQVLVPFGLVLACLSFISSIMGITCETTFGTAALLSSLSSFISFIFITIGLAVFASDALVYVNRFQIEANSNPHRWAMWFLIPTLILSFLSSLCFLSASIINWFDYRNMRVTGSLNHSGIKYNESVCKIPSDSTRFNSKRQYQYQDFTNGCYQINSENDNKQQNSMGYPLQPNSNPNIHQGYPNSLSPTTNKYDPYHSRYYPNENSEVDGYSYMKQFHRQPRSRSRSRSYSRRQLTRRSISSSPSSSSSLEDNHNNNNKNQNTQFIPVPVPYYYPSQPATISTQKDSQNVSYIIPQTVKNLDQTIQPATQTTNVVRYTGGQPATVISNSNQPIYRIAYPTNNNGNMITSNLMRGPAATTYVTAARQLIENIYANNFSDEDLFSKRQYSKKKNTNESWTWHKL